MPQTAPEHVEACLLTQRQMQERALEHLAALKAKIHFPVDDNQRELPNPVTLSEDDLTSLGVRRLSALDVDETAPFDPDPLFFQPFPVEEGDDFRGLVHGSLWFDRTREMSPWKPECELDEQECGTDGLNWGHGHHCLDRENWFLCALQCCGTGILEERTAWQHHIGARGGDSSSWPDCYTRSSYHDDHLHSFRDDCMFSLREPSPELPHQPHLGISVCDTTMQSHQTLTSEVIAALSMMIRRLCLPDYHEKYAYCHTIPVLVYSFHHDAFARVTQMHWDGNDLVLRQSRLLDLRGPKPTPDAYLLLRWMANTPVGVTCYERPDAAAHIAPAPHRGDQKPMVTSTCISVQA